MESYVIQIGSYGTQMGSYGIQMKSYVKHNLEIEVARAAISASWGLDLALAEVWSFDRT